MKKALITGINGQDGSYLSEFLLEKGYDAMNGARPMRRLLQETLEDAIAAGMLEDVYHKGDVVTVKTKKSKEKKTELTYATSTE
mgnify:CR=1 FL=1